LRATPRLRVWATKRRKSSLSGPYQYATSGAGGWLMWSMTSVSSEYGLTTKTGPNTSSSAILMSSTTSRTIVGAILRVARLRHHHRILAAQFERHWNEVLRGGLLHQ
jgi:hypothetical protein